MQAVDETEHSFIATHTGMPNYQQKKPYQDFQKSLWLVDQTHPEHRHNKILTNTTQLISY